jgi:hypothetical protein
MENNKEYDLGANNLLQICIMLIYVAMLSVSYLSIHRKEQTSHVSIILSLCYIRNLRHYKEIFIQL